MELLAALARNEHFARAAEECGISQPAFSARIRNLEEDLGMPIVKRGNRFMGFTTEGALVLKWARTLLANADGLRQEVEHAKGALGGKLKIGVIPTALAFASTLPPNLRRLHPDLVVKIVSTSSNQIIRGLEDFSLDAGISYLDDGLSPLPDRDRDLPRKIRFDCAAQTGTSQARNRDLVRGRTVAPVPSHQRHAQQKNN